MHVKQIEVSFSYVCPVIDHEFSHTIVKAQGKYESEFTDSFDHVMTKFMINNQTDI